MCKSVFCFAIEVCTWILAAAFTKQANKTRENCKTTHIHMYALKLYNESAPNA